MLQHQLLVIFNFQCSRILYRINRLHERLTSSEKIEEITLDLELEAKRFYLFNSGYSNSKPTKNQIIIDLLVILSLVSIIVRHCIYLMNDNLKLLKWTLGDCSDPFESKTAINLIIIGTIMSILLTKIILLRGQVRQKFSMLLVAYESRARSSKNRKMFLNSKNDLKVRTSSVILTYLYFSITRSVTLSIAFLYLVIIFFNYQSFSTAVVQLFWAGFEVIFAFLGLSSCLWIAIHLITGWTYCVYSIDTTTEIGSSIFRSSISCQKKLLQTFYYNQNYIYNFIQNINNESASPLTLTYLIVTFVCVFCFFWSSYYGYGNRFLDIGINIFSFVAFVAANSINIIGSKVVVKVNTINRLIYKLINKTPHSLELKIKALHTLDRLSQRQMGFYLGPMFCFNNYNLLLYILETMSLYILFVCNISFS